MSIRLTCPECKDQLVLKKPVTSTTKVKCRSCGAKFYAGKANQVTQEPDAPAPVVEAAVESAPTATATATAKKKKIRTSKGWRRPRWLVPLGVIGLLVLVVLSVYFSPKPPPPNTTGTLGNVSKPAPKSNPVATELAKDLNQARRPDELIGTWEFLDGPGRLTLEKNGKVKVKGQFIDGLPLDFETRWGLEPNGGIDGTQYNLEFGPQSSLAINHHISVRLQSDGQLKLLKYVTPTGARFEPRLMKKVVEAPATPAPSAPPPMPSEKSSAP